MTVPAHVRAVYVRGPVLARLRAVAARGEVPVLRGPGVPQPELSGLRWSTLGNLHIAGVDAPTAADLARARDELVGEFITRAAPERFAWSLYLDAGARCFVVPFPLAPPPSSTPAGAA